MLLYFPQWRLNASRNEEKKKGGKISTTIALSLTVWQFMNEWSCIFPTQKIYGCPISHLTCFLYWCLEQKLKYFHISWRHQGETASKTMSAPLLSGDSCNPAALPPLQRLLHGHPSQVSCCKGLFSVRACVQWPPNTVTANNLWGLQHQCRLVAWVPVQLRSWQSVLEYGLKISTVFQISFQEELNALKIKEAPEMTCCCYVVWYHFC